jgi:hypothetical protein
MSGATSVEPDKSVASAEAPNYETLAYKILLDKPDLDIISIFKTYARNLKYEEER